MRSQRLPDDMARQYEASKGFVGKGFCGTACTPDQREN